MVHVRVTDFGEGILLVLITNQFTKWSTTASSRDPRNAFFAIAQMLSFIRQRPPQMRLQKTFSSAFHVFFKVVGQGRRRILRFFSRRRQQQYNHLWLNMHQPLSRMLSLLYLHHRIDVEVGKQNTNGNIAQRQERPKSQW